MTVTTTWLGTVSSNWQDAQNWSNGVPVNGSGMDAVVSPAPFTAVLANTDVGGITLTLIGNPLNIDTMQLDNVTLGGSAGSFVLNDAAFEANDESQENNGFQIDGSVTLASNGTIQLTQGLAFDVPGHDGTFENDGTVEAAGVHGGFFCYDQLVNNGVISSAYVVGNLTGTGTIALGSNDNGIEFTGSVASTQTIDFGGITYIGVNASDISQFDGQLINLVPGDTFTLLDVTSGVSIESYNGSILALDTPMGTVDIRASGAIGSFEAEGYVSGTILTAIACYTSGTRIATQRGEVAVQRLRIGDVVQLAEGGAAPVTWLGHRRVDCRRHPRPVSVWPIRIAAHAFGPGRPYRDVCLSPDHAVFVDGVLIPIRYLMNGRTIVSEPRSAVTYWHVELEQHGVVLAEGLPCESYLDTGNRGAFANGGTAVQLHPDFALRVWEAKACAPLVLDGPRLIAAKRRLLSYAAALGHAATDDPDLRLEFGDTVIRPRLIAGGMHRFSLPAGLDVIMIASRSGVPAEISAAASDHRQLGVMVERVILRRPGWQQEVSLDAIPIGDGFYPLERDGMRSWRWTDGNARLSLPAGVADDGKLLLDLHIAAAQESWVHANAATSANGVIRKRIPSAGVAQNESFTAIA